MGRPGGPVEAKRAVDQGLVSADGDVGADICAGRETEDHGGYLSRRVTRLFVCLRKYPPFGVVSVRSSGKLELLEKDLSVLGLSPVRRTRDRDSIEAEAGGPKRQLRLSTSMTRCHALRGS